MLGSNSNMYYNYYGTQVLHQSRDFLLLGENFRGDIVQHGFHWLGWVGLVILTMGASE